MTSDESRKSDGSEPPENKTTFSRRRIICWEHKPPLALVYRAESTRLDVEEITDTNGKSLSAPTAPYLNQPCSVTDPPIMKVQELRDPGSPVA